MPTLKLIATLGKEGVKRSGRIAKKSPPVAVNEGEGGGSSNDNDDRFSQQPDDLNEFRKGRKNSRRGGGKLSKDPSSETETIAPFSIASAIRHHRNLCKSNRTKKEIRSNKGNGNRNGNRGRDSSVISSATDIVAVVLSTAIHQAPMPMSSNSKTPKINNGSSSRVNLLIGDPSLPSGNCARVTMKVSPSSISASLASLLGLLDGMGGGGGSSMAGSIISSPVKGENAKMTRRLGQLQPGDVVRWNRLEVRNDYYGGDNDNDTDTSSYMLGKKQKLSHKNQDKDYASSSKSNVINQQRHHNPLLSVVCDLSLSWRDPAAGPSLARLCRIVPRSTSTSSFAKASGAASGGYDLEWESIIPPSMETSKELVRELASWYCANARPHFSKSTAILPTNQPCQRRRLRDINAPNMLSHVVVKVLRCEKAISAYSTPRKTKTKINADPIVTHATLSDGAGSDDLLGMGGTVSVANHGRISGSSFSSSFLPKSISSILLQSMKEGSRVLLTHTLSQSVNPASTGGGASLQGRESLILVPTRETTAAILTPDHPYYVREKTITHREEENQFVSQPLTLERASQLFSLTQQYSQSVMQELPSGCRRGEMAVTAPLMDIIVDGVDTSFMEGSHWQSPHKLSEFLILRPSISTGLAAIKLKPSYRSATLILDPKSVAREIVVNADGDAMKLLCMDVLVEDMVIDDTSSSPINTVNPYLRHVGELLKVLCTERVPIRWVLEQESECNWFVTNATLLEI